MKHLRGALPFVLVFLCATGLLVFIGIGEAGRVYSQLHCSKISAVGSLVSHSVDTFLVSGLPLRQFTGFDTMTRPLLNSEKSIWRMEIRDRSGAVLFRADQAAAFSSEAPFSGTFEKSGVSGGKLAEVVKENDISYELSFSLKSKFEVAGTLLVYTPKSAVSQVIRRYFLPVWATMSGLVLLFAGIVALLLRRGGEKIRIRIKVIYLVAFLALAVVVLLVLVRLFSWGIQEKTGALAGTLAERLDVAAKLNLDLNDFSGLDKLLDQYREIDPDLSFVTLSRGDTVLVNSVKPGKLEPGGFEFTRTLSSDGQGQDLAIRVGIPRDVVINQVTRSARNFVMLFVATAFLAFMLMNLLFAMRQPRTDLQAQGLDYISPLYFMAMFIEGLFASFLPQYIQSGVRNAHVDPGMTSLVFTMYFITYVISLVPAGRFAEKRGIKPLLVFGIICFGASYGILAFASDILSIFVSRSLAGLGQGTLFIAVQSFIIKNSTQARRTRSTSIIVYGYQGGLISGTAIGALLVAYTGTGGVFLLAAIVSVLIVVYAVVFVPEVRREGAEGPSESMFKGMGTVFKDLEFMLTVVLVGMVTKAVLTGVNSYTLPLIMTSQGSTKEDIGQVLIFYSAAVLCSTWFIARRVDRVGKIRQILTFGAALGGIAIVGMGCTVFLPAHYMTIALIVGCTVLGLAHGCINAPIVTHVTQTRAAAVLGGSTTSSLYRFLERGGHVAGPVVAGGVLTAAGGGPIALAFMGGGVFLFAMVYAAFKGMGTPKGAKIEEENHET